VISPVTAYIPEVLRLGRSWGFAVNLYALRSQRNWGVGDFTDLRTFVNFAAGLGAGVVGTNPLHALRYEEPEAASPYAPTSRYFRNPIYIDVEAVPDYASDAPRAAALRARVASPAFAAKLCALRDEPIVKYAEVARLKWEALEELYAINRNGPRAGAFAAYVQRGGERLERFAVYETLAEHFARQGLHGWLEWPAEFADATSPGVKTWAGRRRRRVDYFKFLQWVGDVQLEAVATTAKRMEIGLYLDVAVGVEPGGADVWYDPRAYVLDETVGAPPDPFGPLGQNWGLPPPSAEALVSDGGAAFSDLLARNMAHAGALRLDHVMALMRLFRIPRGLTPAEGAYVAYPLEELLALASAQSVASRCLIVGEDLGNVPDGFRERMDRHAIFSYRVLLFEREADGSFKAPARYPALSLATATTHDLPPLAGWAVGRDLDIWERTGLMTSDWTTEARAARRVDVSRLVNALGHFGELDGAASETIHRTIDARVPDPAAYDPLVRAAYRYLGRTPSRLVVVALDDALGEFDQVNLPGTFFEYPNWRRKNRLDIETIALDGRIATLAAEVSERVKGGHSS
jgi:4-alpha-glucanotransferase